MCIVEWRMLMRVVLRCGVEECVCVFEGGCCVGEGVGREQLVVGDTLMRARVQVRHVCLALCVYGRSRLLRRGAHRPQSCHAANRRVSDVHCGVADGVAGCFVVSCCGVEAGSFCDSRVW